MNKSWVEYSKTQLMWELHELGEGYGFEVKRGTDRPWDFLMRAIKMELGPGRKLTENWDVLLMSAVYHDSHTHIILKGDYYYIAKEPSLDLIIVPDFEIVGKHKSGILYYRFGDSLVVDIPGLAHFLFGEVNTHTIGKAYSWSNGNSYKHTKREPFKGPFSLNDFQACGNHYRNTGNISGVAWYHTKAGVIQGLKELRDIFPKLTTKGVRDLYSKFGMTPSTTVSKMFLPTKKEEKLPVDKKTPKGLDFFCTKYRLQKHRTGVIMVMGTGDEMVWKDYIELADQLRKAGETITKNQALDLWNKVTGGGD